MKRSSNGVAPPLILRGATQNNLRSLDLDLPHNQLIAVTGVSGSGKSSLAFDTIFAEGQWRYLESLPAYARTLMEKGARPELERIDNVRPAIALEQRNSVRSARSTLGTYTELYDLLRVLYSAAGHRDCPDCGAALKLWTAVKAAEEIIKKLPSGPLTLEANLSETLKMIAVYATRWPQALTAAGFARVRLAGTLLRLDDESFEGHAPEYGATDTVVLNRLTLPMPHERLVTALDDAFSLAGGKLVALAGSEATPAALSFSIKNACDQCGFEAQPLRPVLFSHNRPLGACAECTGFGAVLEWDELKIVPDPSLTLAEGAVEPWHGPSNRWWQTQLVKHANKHELPLDTPWRDLSEKEHAMVWRGTSSFEGINDFFDYLETKRYKMHVRVFMSRYRSPRTCPVCEGARLKPEVLAVRVGGQPISTLCQMPLGVLRKWLEELPAAVKEQAGEALWRIEARLDTLLRLGLHYLTLSRPSRTLSGGELQRAALARQLSNRLTQTLYVLDEPSVGLHPRDVARLAVAFKELRDRDNTVIFVEHDPDLIEHADTIVELGPGGGREGGRIVFQGTLDELKRSDTATGKYLASRSALSNPATGGTEANKRTQVAASSKAPLALTGTLVEQEGQPRRQPSGWLTLTGCNLNNLKSLDVSLPLGTLTCITGVSGSGKSTLLEEVLYPVARTGGGYGPVDSYSLTGELKPEAVKLLDQEPMGRTPRSIPLTYLDIYTPLRKLMAELPAAKRLGLEAAHFSFNTSKGRCPHCEGSGRERIELLFFEDVFVPCDHCGGKRFKAEVLAVRYEGLNINDIMELTVDKAFERFSSVKKVKNALSLLIDMGLGYLLLGQSARTLSGGEAQRLKICSELLGRRKASTLYLMDEPTTGMHGEDVGKLMGVLQRLVDRGDTVIVVEHNLDLICQADWMVDLGPEGGDAGGLVVDAGMPREVAARALGPTGQYLAKYYSERKRES